MPPGPGACARRWPIPAATAADRLVDRRGGRWERRDPCGGARRGTSTGPRAVYRPWAASRRGCRRWRMPPRRRPAWLPVPSARPSRGAARWARRDRRSPGSRLAGPFPGLPGGRSRRSGRAPRRGARSACAKGRPSPRGGGRGTTRCAEIPVCPAWRSPAACWWGVARRCDAAVAPTTRRPAALGRSSKGGHVAGLWGEGRSGGRCMARAMFGKTVRSLRASWGTGLPPCLRKLFLFLSV